MLLKIIVVIVYVIVAILIIGAIIYLCLRKENKEVEPIKPKGDLNKFIPDTIAFYDKEKNEYLTIKMMNCAKNYKLVSYF